MITTILKWSDDIDSAPKGEYVSTDKTIIRGGKVVSMTSTDYVAPRLMALTKCGKVVSTKWLPDRLAPDGTIRDGGRWDGFNPGSSPLLWAEWPDGVELSGSLSVVQNINFDMGN